MPWLTRKSLEYEVTKIDWLIAVFTGTNKDYGNPDPDIKSWTQPVVTIKDLLKKIFNLKGELYFCPYRWLDGLKWLSIGGTHKGWKYYQGVIHNSYNGGHIVTDHHVI